MARPGGLTDEMICPACGCPAAVHMNDQVRRALMCPDGADPQKMIEMVRRAPKVPDLTAVDFDSGYSYPGTQRFAQIQRDARAMLDRLGAAEEAAIKATGTRGLDAKATAIPGTWGAVTRSTEPIFRPRAESAPPLPSARPDPKRRFVLDEEE